MLESTVQTTEDILSRKQDDEWSLPPRWTRDELAVLQAIRQHEPFSTFFGSDPRTVSLYDTLDWLAHLHLRNTPEPEGEHDIIRWRFRHAYHPQDYHHAARLVRALASAPCPIGCQGVHGADCYCGQLLDEWRAVLSLVGDRPPDRDPKPPRPRLVHAPVDQLLLF